MTDHSNKLFHWETAVLTSTLTPTQRLILLVLRTFCRPGKPTCWPSLHTLSARTGLNRRTVQRNLRILSAHGWLIITPETQPENKHPTPTYTLRLPRGGRHRTARGGGTGPPKEGIGREKEADPHISCQLTPKTKTNTGPESIQDILEGVKVAESPTAYTNPRATLLAAALALEEDPKTARPFWTRRLYDLERAGLTHHAQTIIDYATSCNDPNQRRAKDLGAMQNPAAWANAKTSELLKL